MIRYQCIVAYDGTNYEGWQSQGRNTSIQEKIEDALFQITQSPIRIVGAGRTDAGVHAIGQVFHFDTKLEMTPYKWKGALNGLLSEDIHIQEVIPVNELFHARYCVKQKQYTYTIHVGEYDVLSKNYAYQCPYSLNVKKMKEAAQYFVGTHDFTSFCSTPTDKDPVREIQSITIKKSGNLIKMIFVGKGFLRYMVRMMSAQLIEVGRGKVEPDHIQWMLDHPSKVKYRKNAQPQGLCLDSISYFQLLAKNEETMIREFLSSDLVFISYEKLEASYSSNTFPKYYAFTTRNTQELLGYLKVGKRKKELLVSNKKDMEKAKKLIKELGSNIIIKIS